MIRRAVSSIAVDSGALRESRPFRRLFIGQLISLVGRQITTIAVPFQIFLLTHSPLAVGAAGVVQAVPLVAASLGAGPLTDRFDRRRILLVTQLCLAGCSALLAVGALWGRPPVAAIYVVVAAAAGIGAVDSPARTAIVPNVVRPERLAGALSLNFAMFSTAIVAGPALGGLVIARTGLPLAYTIDVATFGAALYAVFRLPPQRPHGEHHEPPVQAIKRGLDYAKTQPVILGGFAMDLCAMVFGMPRALFPVLATTTFHAGAQGLGFMYAAIGVGSAVGALSTGWMRRTPRLGRVIVVAIAVWGVAIIGSGFVTHFWIAPALLIVAGAADSLSAVSRSTIMQTLVPDSLRGRLSALYFMVVAGGPYVGDLESGGVASAFSVQISIVSGGVLCLAGLAAVALLVPSVWRHQQPPQGPTRLDTASFSAADTFSK